MPFIPFYNPVQVRYTRTIVGWYNLYLVDFPDKPVINLAPADFFELFPTVSKRAKYGCSNIDYEIAESLFGSLRVSA